MGRFGFRAGSIITFAILFLFHSRFTSALNPSAIIRAANAGALEDTCQCDCCYNVGRQGQRTECIPPIDTSYDTKQCSACSVEACAAAFPVACGQESSVVSTDCIKRKGWMLRLVPILFIFASCGLLLYGLFFKTYDGYHDDSRTTISSVSQVLLPHKIPGFGTFPLGQGQGRDGERGNVTVLTTSKLPPIYEYSEVAVQDDVASGSSSSLPSVEDDTVGSVAVTPQSSVGRVSSYSAVTAADKAQAD